MRKALRDFLVFGLSPVFPAKEGELVRGIPTAWSVSASGGIVAESSESVPVWVHVEGSVRGLSVAPLCRSAPEAPLVDPSIWLWLIPCVWAALGNVRRPSLKSISVC